MAFTVASPVIGYIYLMNACPMFLLPWFPSSFFLFLFFLLGGGGGVWGAIKSPSNLFFESFQIELYSWTYELMGSLTKEQMVRE